MLTTVGKLFVPGFRFAQKPTEVMVWPGAITLLKLTGWIVTAPLAALKLPFQLT